MPAIDYNDLLNTHPHFAFGGWVTLALLVLMTNTFLNDKQRDKPVYQYIFWSIFLSSWAYVFILPFSGYATISRYISIVFILTTYVFTWLYFKDIRSSFRDGKVSRTVYLLSFSGLICLVLSSVGPFMLTYLFAVKSLNAVLYRDALFSYLHLQYNGFFTLSVFALLFQKLELNLSLKEQKNVHRFSVWLVVSVLPSMFLSYHWSDPSDYFHAIAYSGSTLSLISLVLFIIVFRYIVKVYKSLSPLLKSIGFLSLFSFMMKMLLQSLTIFNIIGNPVFGDRPIIIGFLHMVFLGFVTLFLLIYFAQTGIFHINKRITRYSLVLFTFGVVINEVFLWTQGIDAIFLRSSDLFPWFLWGASILLVVSALLIYLSRMKSTPDLVNAVGNK